MDRERIHGFVTLASWCIFENESVYVCVLVRLNIIVLSGVSTED